MLLEPGGPLGDRAGEVDAGHRRALPELGLGGQLRLAERRNAQGGQVAKRAHKPGRGDDLVRLDRHRHRVVAALQRHGQRARRRSADALGARREDVDAAAEDRVLERLDIARPDPDQGSGLDRGLRRRRRREGDPAGPLEEPRRQLEARVLLADDEQALAGVRLGVAGVGVVHGEVDAGRVGGVGLRDPDREDREAAAVLALVGDEDEPVALGGFLVPRRLPLAAIAHHHARAVREGRQVRLHLRARGEVGGAIQELRGDPAQLRLGREEAVPVPALELSGRPIGRRVGLRPRQQSLEERPLPEHPAGARVAGDDGVLDPQPAEEVRDLERSRARAHDDDRILARRVRAPVGGRAVGHGTTFTGSP